MRRALSLKQQQKCLYFKIQQCFGFLLSILVNSFPPHILLLYDRPTHETRALFKYCMINIYHFVEQLPPPKLKKNK